MMNKRIIIAMCCSISLICGAFPFNAVADDPVDPENVNVSEVPTEAANYFVWFENVEQSAIMEDASVKANEYEDTLDRTEYTSREIEELKTDYYKKLLRELTSAAITERAESIMAELGIDKNKAVISKYAPMIVCELTPEQFAAAESCELVTSVSPYEALEVEDATDGQLTTIPPIEDMASILPGDANEDYLLTLNDAVAVLQYIALPKKYPLKPQGLINADCDGIEGISGGDALWIQKADAGLT